MFMQRVMKYVVVLECETYERMYLFPQDEEHRDFAARMGLYPVRAGFVTLMDGQLSCGGESVSLNLKGDRKADTRLLNRQINQDYTP